MFLLITNEMLGTGHYTSTLDALNTLRKHNASENGVGTDESINNVMGSAVVYWDLIPEPFPVPTPFGCSSQWASYGS